MKREHVLALMRIAGYHGDPVARIRLYVENRISINVAQVEYRKGEIMRENGVACHCHECREAKP